MAIIDISYSFKNGMTKYPSLLPYEKKWLKHYDLGDNMALSYFQTPSHNGTHLDAPLHYSEGGKMMHEIPLEIFMGEALVVDVPKEASSVEVKHLEKFQSLPKRVLFKTSNSDLGYLGGKFKEDYVHIEAETARYLVDKGVKLVGIDYVSVDAKVSPDKETHHAFLDNEMIILETIKLDHVEEGLYTLVAFPVKAEDVEASLCRAVLID